MRNLCRPVIGRLGERNLLQEIFDIIVIIQRPVEAVLISDQGDAFGSQGVAQPVNGVLETDADVLKFGIGPESLADLLSGDSFGVLQDEEE